LATKNRPGADGAFGDEPLDSVKRSADYSTPSAPVGRSLSCSFSCRFTRDDGWQVVLTKIGVELEPWTDLSLFDTDILSSKARQAGFTLACARDCFVHHFGTRTFAHGSPAVKKLESQL